MNPLNLSSKDRRLLGLSVGIFSLAGIVTLYSTVWPLLRIGEPPKMKGKPYFKLVASPEKLAISRNHVLRLRTKWEGWARKNAPLLKRMRKSHPDDRATMTAVLNALPYPGREDFPFQIGPEDMGNPSAGEAGVSFFTGEQNLPYNRDDPNQSLLHEKAVTGQQKIVNDAFMANRDIPILGSDDSGPTQYVLWASGRVTEVRVTLEPERTAALAFREIAPSFEFAM